MPDPARSSLARKLERILRRVPARPVVIDLFCGLGGWAEGFLAEDWDVIGFDIERHDYGTGGYPAQLVLQDVLTLHGSQFSRASCIVASPPCQEFSYRAMPWKRAKAQVPKVLPPWWKKPEPQMSPEELSEWRSWRTEHPLTPPDLSLFNACFRIAAEAGVPLVVENVKGAQPWVGAAKWHYGSYYLWGDIPALMPPPGKTPPGKTPPGNAKGAPRWEDRPVSRLCDSPVDHGVKVSDLNWSGSDKPHGARRKAASAQIAKIPFPLAVAVARAFDPRRSGNA